MRKETKNKNVLYVPLSTKSSVPLSKAVPISCSRIILLYFKINFIDLKLSINVTTELGTHLVFRII